MRVRGLKPILTQRKIRPVAVAPHAGAWIETLYLCHNVLRNLVAPHAGAWIETTAGGGGLKKQASHPMRVRGLKQLAVVVVSRVVVSHPMRVRGLKHT